MTLKEAGKIYFVGIGGIGMSGLARLLKAHGKGVEGSDSHASATLTELEQEGIPTRIGHGDLPSGVELVVFSEAVPLDLPELEQAADLGIKMMTYFEALGEFSRDYRCIAIAGTHGKTTTTAMLALIMEVAGMDPTVVVGSKLSEFESKNVRVGESEWLLVEACEYRRNFLSLKPQLLGVLNMEVDHVDYFDDYKDYLAAYQELADQSEEVLWPDDVSEYEGELGIPGVHNLKNAGMAAHLARRLGINQNVISMVLASFKGTWRRFEYRGTCNGAVVYDDYAHHPTAIAATLQAAREKHPDARIVAVFQPHQYSRTAHFLDEFAEAFDDADEVIIPNIYEARDSDEHKSSVSVEDLVEAIQPHVQLTHGGDGLNATAHYLRESAQSGELILVMGAGDITHMIPLILDEGGVGGA